MAQKSIVLELQQLASGGNANVSELLRKSLVIANKLKLFDFKKWIESELSGYEGSGLELPPYRVVQSMVKALNPVRGMIPVQFEDAATEKYYSRTQIRNSLPEIEDMVRCDSGSAMVKLNPEHAAGGGYGLRFDTYQVLSRNHLVGVIEAVRTTILDWALRLEDEGILGEGMTFSNDDRDRAAKSTKIHIRNFRGVLGDVSANNLQIGDYSSIHERLKEAGISQEERNELENILDELKRTEEPRKRDTLIQRGMDWLGRNAQNIGALATMIRDWFQKI